MSATAAELEQRLIDGDTTVTREAIEKAREDEARDSAWTGIRKKAAEAKAERDQKAADDAGFTEFWKEFSAEHARFNGVDGEMATAKDAVTEAVAALIELVERKQITHRELKQRHEYYFARGYRPDKPLSGESLLWSDHGFGEHPIHVLPYVQVKQAVEAALERN